MLSCHYHPQREGVYEVKVLKGSDYFICERCWNEDSALEADLREALGKCQECGCETDDFTEDCDHCITYHEFVRGIRQDYGDTRYERLQLAGDR